MENATKEPISKKTLALLHFVIAIVLIAVDQYTKYLALVHLKPIHTTGFIPHLVRLTFVENRGVAFGMLSGKLGFILCLTILISLAMLIYYVKLPDGSEYRLVKHCMAFIFAGAIGNIIDRIFRGYVVDFFEFEFFTFPVFNFADIFVVCGVTVLSFLILFVIKEPEEVETEAKEVKAEEVETGEAEAEEVEAEELATEEVKAEEAEAEEVEAEEVEAEEVEVKK
ncbi:MAG: signal peptidase II [Bacillota bacterium]